MNKHVFVREMQVRVGAPVQAEFIHGQGGVVLAIKRAAGDLRGRG